MTAVYTVIGGAGFMGAALASAIRSTGATCFVPPRSWQPSDGEDLGHVLYAAGVTGNFLTRRHNTIAAHVCLVNAVLERTKFESLLYFSSTHVYKRTTTTHEDSPVIVQPNDPADLYNASKLAGESICLGHESAKVRVARLSNIVGPDFGSQNFLTSIIKTAVTHGHIALESSLESEKDYLLQADAIDLILKIASHGQHRIYNVASGHNITNAAIVAAIAEVSGCSISIAPNAPSRRLAPINTTRIQNEFGFSPKIVLEIVAKIVGDFRSSQNSSAS